MGTPSSKRYASCPVVKSSGPLACLSNPAPTGGQWAPRCPLGLTWMAVVAFVQSAWHPWILYGLALTPAALGILALFGALSGVSLTAEHRRAA